MRLFQFAAFTLAALTIPSLANAEFTVIAGWENQLFPAYIIATASVKAVPEEESDTERLGDAQGVIGIDYEATEDDEAVRVTVQCDGFLETSTLACRLPTQGDSYQLFPKIRFRYDKLSRCRQATPATLTVTVQSGSSEPEEQSCTVVFRSINDCPLYIKLGEESVDTQFTFAAFVNEEHPYVDKLMREALDRGVVSNFFGYQGNDTETVFRQVYALWDLMVARDVRYSDITTTAAESPNVLSQHVRMIEETANNSQANCVDGSVLFVSMLRKIGINASLVLEPGHCYVVFSADEAGERLYGLETTAIESTVELPDDVPDFFNDAVAEELRGVISWPSFIYAVSAGTQKLQNNLEKYQSKADPQYKIINVAEARLRGILPIAFDSQELFVAYDHSAGDEANSDEEATEDVDDDEDSEAEEE